MMFELIPFDSSRMVLLAEVSANWINFDYLRLTSFVFCKTLIAACSQDIPNYCSPHNLNSYFYFELKRSQNIRRKSAGYSLHIEFTY